MDRVAFSQRAPLRLVRCHECGLVYRNPVERATDASEIYEEEGLDEAVLQTLHETQRPAYDAQAARLTEVFGRRGSGIEVGSYVGGFLAAARDAGWQFTGVDVNARTNAFTRSLGFQVHDGKLGLPRDMFADPAFDRARATANEVMDYLRRHGPFEPHRLPLDDLEYTTMHDLEARLADRWTPLATPESAVPCERPAERPPEEVVI